MLMYVFVAEIPANTATKLSIVGSGMEVLDDEAIRNHQLNALNLAKNNIIKITDNSLIYSAKTLSALDLSFNRLQKVPHTALAGLSSLRFLSLESNEINSLLVEWNYLKQTLNTLHLGGNDLNVLTSGIDFTLANFQELLSLNINDNYITNLEENSLPFTLKTLYASNNLIEEFPTHLVNNLDGLSKLYLNDNYIKNIPTFKFKDKKQLETLDLSDNLITNVNDFMGNSMLVKEIDLSHNHITSISAFAFNGALCTKLDLSSNRIAVLNEKAFYGLRNTIENLDLSRNQLSKIPKSVVSLRRLKQLSLSHNTIQSIPDSTFKNSSQYLYFLQLSGNYFHSIPKAALRNIKRLIRLEMSYNAITYIKSSDFMRWGDHLESLYLKSNNIDSLEYNAFKNLPKLRKLGLAFNNIRSIDSKAFSNLAVPLVYLDLSSALRKNDFPEDSLKTLKNLEQLVLTGNNITNLPKVSLYNFAKLKTLNLDFNKILEIPETFFNSVVLKHLKDIRLGFNRLHTIDKNTFLDLPSLEFIGLNDNQIRSINDGAFKNLQAKLTITLANNEIHVIHPNSFQNIPNFINLDLHNNDLQSLDWNMFNNVTSNMLPLTLNLSRNRIENIVQPTGYRPISVSTLDLSHNKLKQINSESFRLFNDSLRTLIFDYNELSELPERVFWMLKSLVILKIEHNKLKDIRENTFMNLEKLQVLDLSHNHISRINIKQFANLWNLRILDLSHNEISTIPGDSFQNTKLERLILKNNRFSIIPSQSFYPIDRTLQHLDISNNMIEHLERDFFNSIKSLTDLNLCSNYLSQIPDYMGTGLDKLLNLQLCNNKLSLNNFNVINRLKQLRYLNLADTNIRDIPNGLQLEHLVSLNLSGNGLSQLRQGFLFGTPNLRQLDLSRNNLTNWGIIGWNQAQYLKELDISNNPIKTLTKDTFEGLDNLKILNIQNLHHLERFDSDSLTKCKLLHWLKIQTWPNIEKYRFRLPSVVFGLKNLKKLTVEVLEDKLTDQLVQAFPPKLKYLEITGGNLKEVAVDSLKGLDNKNELVVKFHGTNITTFPPLFFARIGGRLTVDLRRNQLDQVGPEMFYKSLKSIRKLGTKIYSGGIHVQNNPILCNCDSHWLGYWMRRYLLETLRIHQKEPEYSRDVIENMKESTCINPLNGRHTPILTFEMEGCDVSYGQIAFGVNLFLMLATIFIVYFIR
ncbi:hypothetical protein O3M35_010133 [Rhynocoris fuscipes]|uniref:Chaoptin n=1 Tax=Rhynocoris fuscipes TaxID=488301 RepID=A0AAW1CXS3_9HEMI